MQSLVRAGNQVLSATAARNLQLTRTVDSLPPFLAQLRRTLLTLNGTLGIARPTLAALMPVAPLLRPALSEVVALSGPAVKLLHETPTLLADSDKALPAIGAFTAAFNRTVGPLLAAARQVVPIINFIQLYPREVTAGMSNLAAFLNARAPAGGGVTRQYLRAMFALNNESLFGQTQRPGSNRHNAYISPGELAYVGKGGLLSSDCNNIGNPDLGIPGSLQRALPPPAQVSLEQGRAHHPVGLLPARDRGAAVGPSRIRSNAPMKVDAMVYVSAVPQAGPAATASERFGYDGFWTTETQADPLIACALAAQATEDVQIGTGIAVAFARNPMTIALQANDVHLLSGGRFLLGLGSQVKAHIQRRYSMPWSHPAPRMREFILAIRAIWRAWETGDKLDFRGDFYSHTLMTPFFNPGPNPRGNPKIILAAVGPKMAEVAGEVADGVFCHLLGTERYLREVTLPALQRGAARAGRSLEGFEITAPGIVVARDSEEERAAGVEFVRGQIGFYGSTPAYRPVLELHGWGELQQELNALTRQGAWDQLAGLVDDEVVNTFGIVATPEEAAAEIRRRYGDVATRITLDVPDDADPERWRPVFEALREPVPAAQ